MSRLITTKRPDLILHLGVNIKTPVNLHQKYNYIKGPITSLVVFQQEDKLEPSRFKKVLVKIVPQSFTTTILV